MTSLDNWLQQATRGLAKDSVNQVRREIQEHFESAREAAIGSGATSDEADRVAVTALGDAKTANCRYRVVLLTAVEAKLLREGNCEARAICSRPWLKGLLIALPAAMLVAATVAFVIGASSIARTLLAGSIGMGVFLAAPFLPVYTPSRARVFRTVKWAAMIGVFVMAFGSEAIKWSWLWMSCLWPLAWIEITRVSIRRKLRVADWPKQLYL